MGREYMGSSVAKVCCGLTLASFVFAGLATGTSEAAPSLDKPEPIAEVPLGAYLAGRHAQQERDYRAAATWFENALKADPGSPELITRAFLMEASVGDFGRAKPLAESELKLDATDAMADLILLIDRVKAGDNAGAVARAEALPADGVHRFVRPLALTWTRMGIGDVSGAEAALQELDKFNGFAPLKDFQLGLIEDLAGRADLAEDNFKKTLGASPQLNWRLTDTMANFYERHGRNDEAQALYERFVKDNAGSELAESILDGRPVRRARRSIPPRTVSPRRSSTWRASSTSRKRSTCHSFTAAARCNSVRIWRWRKFWLPMSSAPRTSRTRVWRSSLKSRTVRPIRGRHGCASLPISSCSTAPTRRSLS